MTVPEFKLKLLETSTRIILITLSFKKVTKLLANGVCNNILNPIY